MTLLVVRPLPSDFQDTISHHIGEQVFLRGHAQRTPWDGEHVFSLNNPARPIDLENDTSGYLDAKNSPQVKSCVAQFHDIIHHTTGMPHIHPIYRIDALWKNGAIIRHKNNAPALELPTSCLPQRIQNGTKALTSVVLFLPQSLVQQLDSAHGQIKLAHASPNTLFPKGDSAPFLKSPLTDVHICQKT